MRRGRQNDVVGLDAGKLFEDGPRRVPEARALLPHFETLPEHEGEEANEDVSLDAVLALMPDRTQVQLILLNAKRGFGLGELDVSLPELLVAPIADVRAQEIGALRERGPIIERGVVIDAEAKARRAAVKLQDDREAGGGALVLLEDASDLSIHSRRVERFLGARKASREAFERLLDPPTELVVHRMLFAAPVGGAALAMPRSAIQTRPSTPCRASIVATMVCRVWELWVLPANTS